MERLGSKRWPDKQPVAVGRLAGGRGRQAATIIEEVACTWRFTKNNEITEGFHTKMEMISRRAFGFRNFQNYRLRVRVLCA